MEVSKSGTNTKVEQGVCMVNRMYRKDRETEKVSGGQVIQIGQDNTGDHLSMSGDVPGGLEMDLGCHGYDTCTTSLSTSSPTTPFLFFHLCH